MIERVVPWRNPSPRGGRYWWRGDQGGQARAPKDEGLEASR